MSDLGSIDFDDGQDFYFGEYEGARNEAGERHGEGKETFRKLFSEFFFQHFTGRKISGL